MVTDRKESGTTVNYTFAGHQTFALRSGWLKKGYDAVHAHGSSIFAQDQALAVLGVGKNMVTSIRYWMLITNMLAENKNAVGKSGGGFELTPQAHLLLADDGFDPYLEKDTTLWLLHSQLCSYDSPAYTWFYAFHRWRRTELLRDTLSSAIWEAAQVLPRCPSPETVSRDTECFFHTYAKASRAANGGEEGIDIPLSTLGLIQTAPSGGFRFAVGSKPRLSAAVFAYALGRYWQRQRPTAETISAVEIMYDEGMPGALFKLDENSVNPYLDALETVTKGVLRFEDNTQNPVVVRTAAHINESAFLKACYAR